MAKDAKQNPKQSKEGRGANEKKKPRTRRGDKEPYKPGRNTHSPRFKGNSHDLEGYIFDCSDNKQADIFVHTLNESRNMLELNTATVAILDPQLNKMRDSLLLCH